MIASVTTLHLPVLKCCAFNLWQFSRNVQSVQYVLSNVLMSLTYWIVPHFLTGTCSNTCMPKQPPASFCNSLLFWVHMWPNRLNNPPTNWPSNHKSHMYTNKWHTYKLALCHQLSNILSSPKTLTPTHQQNRHLTDNNWQLTDQCISKRT